VISVVDERDRPLGAAVDGNLRLNHPLGRYNIDAHFAVPELVVVEQFGREVVAAAVTTAPLGVDA
jgi:hypothetical protein